MDQDQTKTIEQAVRNLLSKGEQAPSLGRLAFERQDVFLREFPDRVKRLAVVVHNTLGQGLENPFTLFVRAHGAGFNCGLFPISPTEDLDNYFRRVSTMLKTQPPDYLAFVVRTDRVPSTASFDSYAGPCVSLHVECPSPVGVDSGAGFVWVRPNAYLDMGPAAEGLGLFQARRYFAPVFSGGLLGPWAEDSLVPLEKPNEHAISLYRGGRERPLPA